MEEPGPNRPSANVEAPGFGNGVRHASHAEAAMEESGVGKDPSGKLSTPNLGSYLNGLHPQNPRHVMAA